MKDNNKTAEDKPKNLGGRPRKYKSVRQMTMRINKYFDEKEIPTKAGLALYLGFCSKDALNEYKEYKGFSDLIGHTFLKIEQFWTENLAKANHSGSAFWLKNNAGYTDKQIIVSEKPAEVSEEEKKAYEDAASTIKLRLSKLSPVKTGS